MRNRLRRVAPLLEKATAAATALCLALALAGCGGEQEPARQNEAQNRPEEVSRGTIAAVGDSLTAGLGLGDESQAYPALLEAKLKAAGYNFRVVNAGVSGETSSGTRSRIEWVISRLEPDLVILETGANDGLRGIDPEVLRGNLDAIVTTLKKNGVTVLLAGMRMLPNMGPEYTEKFAAVYPEIARRHDVPLIPFFLEGVAGEPALNQPDRIHPTAEGYVRIVGTVYPYVRQAIEDMSAAN